MTTRRTHAAVFSTPEQFAAWKGEPSPAWMRLHTATPAQLSDSIVAHVRDLTADESVEAIEDANWLGDACDPNTLAWIDLYVNGEWYRAVMSARDSATLLAMDMIRQEFSRSEKAAA